MNAIDIGVIDAMRKYGGNFVKHLAALYIAADPDNRERIKDAFVEVWMKYLAMSMDMETEDSE